MTPGYGGQFTTNASSITTASTFVLYAGKQWYPIFSASVTYTYLKVKWSGTPNATNTTMDVNLGQNATSYPGAPTDGVGIRANNTGVFGFSIVNGTEQTSGVFPARTNATTISGNFAPVAGVCYDMIISSSSKSVTFWVDFQFGNGFETVAKIALSTSTRRPINNTSGCLNIRHAISGVAASAVVQMQVVEAVICNEGVAALRDSRDTQALISGGMQGQQGQTMGSLALYTNNLAAGAGAAMTNTTAALGTGLGGQFSALPTLAVGTDGIVSSYQNPVPTAGIPAVNLLVRGFKVEAVVTTVLASAGPVVYAVSLAYGHTGISLATTEANATKAPRRIPLGIMTFATNAAVGTTGQVLSFNFRSPQPVYPGEYVAIVAKNLGSVTTAGVVTFIITPDVQSVM
jgi:hypothetical protein